MKVIELNMPPSIHASVRDFAETVQTILNGGAYEMTVTNTVPSGAVNVGEGVLYTDGSSTHAVCYYLGSAIGWKCATLS